MCIKFYTIIHTFVLCLGLFYTNKLVVFHIVFKCFSPLWVDGHYYPRQWGYVFTLFVCLLARLCKTTQPISGGTVVCALRVLLFQFRILPPPRSAMAMFSLSSCVHRITRKVVGEFLLFFLWLSDWQQLIRFWWWKKW